MDDSIALTHAVRVFRRADSRVGLKTEQSIALRENPKKRAEECSALRTAAGRN
jgi:hypothetical protein